MSETPSLVTEEDTRGRGPKCLYCPSALGTPHAEDCVCYTKKVKVRVTLEYEIERPHSWDDKMIFFSLNQGTRCKDHIIEEIQDLLTKDYGEDGKHQCLCWLARYDLVKDSDEPLDPIGPL